jgi:hypothetical protein
MVGRHGVPKDPGCTALAILLGLGIGWLDIHTTEVTVTIASLLVSGVLCGTVQARGPWRWGLLIALGVPVVEAIARVTHVATAEPVHLDPRVWLVVAIFALGGCYVGAFIGRGLRAMTHSASVP